MPNPIPITDQINYITRELKLRMRTYPNLVRMGKMPQGKMDYEVECMQAVLATLERLARPGQAELFAPTAPEEPSHA